MRLPSLFFRRATFSLLTLLVVHAAAGPVEAQDSVFQIVALNRLMQVVSDAMLPLSFDFPVSPGAQPLAAQISEVWYCDGDKNATASAVVVVSPYAR